MLRGMSRPSEIHLVVLVRDDDRWIILDNRTLTLVDSIAATQYEPLIEFGANGVRDFRPHSLRMEDGSRNHLRHARSRHSVAVKSAKQRQFDFLNSAECPLPADCVKEVLFRCRPSGKILRTLVHLSCCEVRDHMNYRKNDRRSSYQFYSASQRQKSPKRYICEIFEPRDFGVFSTQSAISGSRPHLKGMSGLTLKSRRGTRQTRPGSYAYRR